MSLFKEKKENQINNTRSMQMQKKKKIESDMEKIAYWKAMDQMATKGQASSLTFWHVQLSMTIPLSIKCRSLSKCPFQ